jgi:hypothetical protein
VEYIPFLGKIDPPLASFMSGSPVELLDEPVQFALAGFFFGEFILGLCA